MPGDQVAPRDAVAAEIYGECLSAAASEDCFDGVTFWGFCDKHSWVHSFYAPDRPLLWDEKYVAKQAFHSVREALLKEGGEEAAVQRTASTWGSWRRKRNGKEEWREDGLVDEPDWARGEKSMKE